MPLTTLAATKLSAAGDNPATGGSVPDAGGHRFRSTGREFLRVAAVTNPVTVTIETPNTVEGLAIPDRSVSVPAGEQRLIGPFDPDVYHKPVNDANAPGQCLVTYTNFANATVKLYQLPQIV